MELTRRVLSLAIRFRMVARREASEGREGCWKWPGCDLACNYPAQTDAVSACHGPGFCLPAGSIRFPSVQDERGLGSAFPLSL